MIAIEHKEQFRDAVYEAIQDLADVSGRPVDDTMAHAWIVQLEQQICGETFWGGEVRQQMN